MINVEKNQYILVFIMMLLIPLNGIGIDIVAPSLPAIALQFQVSAYYAKFSIIFYLIALAIAQPVIGSLSDRLGRRIPLLIALFCFISVSIYATLSHDLWGFLLMRFLQGLFVSAPFVIIKAAVTDIFQGERLRVMGTYLVTAWSLGLIFAPVLGGYLQELFGWKSSFYFLSGYVFFAFILVYCFFPETLYSKSKFKLKSLGVQYWAIVSNYEFLTYMFFIILGYSFLIAFSTAAPFLMQQGFLLSASEYGWMAMALGAFYFFGSLVNRVVLRYWDTKKLIRISAYCLFSLSVMLCFLTAFRVITMMYLTFLGSLLFFFVSLVYSNAMGVCLGLFPKSAGSASAVIGTMNMLGVFFVSFLAGYIESIWEFSFLYFTLSLLMVFLCRRL